MTLMDSSCSPGMSRESSKTDGTGFAAGTSAGCTAAKWAAIGSSLATGCDDVEKSMGSSVESILEGKKSARAAAELPKRDSMKFVFLKSVGVDGVLKSISSSPKLADSCAVSFCVSVSPRSFSSTPNMEVASNSGKTELGPVCSSNTRSYLAVPKVESRSSTVSVFVASGESGSSDAMVS